MLYEDYYGKIDAALRSICQEQGDKLMRAARMAADVIEGDGLIYIFGCGHSHLLACESFYRAGGLACVAPIFYEPLMLHESASESSRLEKESGLARRLLERYSVRPGDMLICISTSDKNAVPVEYAKAVSDMGVPTVALCSREYFQQEAHNACSLHLHEVCDLYLDNMAPFGDACLQLRGAAAPMAPLSTVTGSFIINSILAEAAQLALDEGYNVPLYLSGNIPGGAEKNRALIERYSRRIAAL